MQNAVVSHYLRPFKPNTHQTDAAVRFVRRSRFQRGTILFHSMGSGKTLTTVYILENYKKGFKWLIILPKGLDSEWTGAFDMFMAGSPDVDELKRIKQNTTFLSYKELAGMVMNVDKFTALCDLFKDSYVVCDEAHRLLAILRSQPQQSEEDESFGSVRPLDRAFALAKRIVLVTGTPVQRSFGDLAMLVNVVAGDTVAPPLDSMFKQHYGQRASFVQNMVSMAGTVSNVVVPTVERLMSLYCLSQTASAFIGWGGGAGGGDGGEDGNGAGGLFSKYSPFIYTGLFFLQGVSYVNQVYNKIVVDGEKIARELGPYISYYDALRDESMLAKTPEKTVVNLKLPMSDFQMLQFISLAHDAGTSNLTEFKIVSRIVESDKIGASLRNVDSVEDFIRLGRVIGNLSVDNLAFTTERMKYLGDRVVDLKEYNYQAVFRNDCPAGIRNYNRDQKPVFMCPKYNLCLKELLKMRKVATFPYTYMPVVYSCFDRYGFQTFSAFLTSMAIPHLIVHPEDDILHRTAVLKVAKSPTTAWPATVNGMKELDPLCVLIHPTLTEGLSFSYNPAIFVLEMPFGFGVQEQIYARVIRTLSDQDVAMYGLTREKRFPKKIVQFSCENGFSLGLADSRVGRKYGLTDVTVPGLPIIFQGLQDDSNWGIFLEGSVNFFPSKQIAKKTEIDEILMDYKEAPVVYQEIERNMENYRILYYPRLKMFLSWVELSPMIRNLMLEPRLGKSSKDFVTQYLEDFKFGANKTPDQWAFEVNTRQKFDLRALTEALSSEKLKDANADAPPPIPVPFDVKNAPRQNAADIPADILACHLYDPLHPNDPLACNLKAMSLADENLPPRLAAEVREPVIREPVIREPLQARVKPRTQPVSTMEVDTDMLFGENEPAPVPAPKRRREGSD
jgi:hypothetical protein